MPDTIKAKDSTAMAETIENYFLSGEVDKIEIAYSRLGFQGILMDFNGFYMILLSLFCK